MKLAVPTSGKVVDDHFGHCEAYTVFTIGDNMKIVNVELLPSPQGCGCKSNIAGVLQQNGVKIMLAGNVGGSALNVLSDHGIKVYRGCWGDVHQLVEMFLKGNVEDSGLGCQHHHIEGHMCSHSSYENLNIKVAQEDKFIKHVASLQNNDITGN